MKLLGLNNQNSHYWRLVVLATSKCPKMSVGPKTATTWFSENNYSADLPDRLSKSTMYYVNWMIPYYKWLKLSHFLFIWMQKKKTPKSVSYAKTHTNWLVGDCEQQRTNEKSYRKEWTLWDSFVKVVKIPEF